MSLPTDARLRKQIPLFRGFMLNFPDAMAAVAQLSFVANEQHNPGEPMRWDKDKSADEQDAELRHMMDAITNDRDIDGVMHKTKKAWRAMADLQRLADSGVDIYASLQEEK